ncbi:unnamed protein product [Sphagnum tenellum]
MLGCALPGGPCEDWTKLSCKNTTHSGLSGTTQRDYVCPLSTRAQLHRPGMQRQERSTLLVRGCTKGDDPAWLHRQHTVVCIRVRSGVFGEPEWIEQKVFNASWAISADILTRLQFASDKFYQRLSDMGSEKGIRVRNLVQEFADEEKATLYNFGLGSALWPALRRRRTPRAPEVSTCEEAKCPETSGSRWKCAVRAGAAAGPTKSATCGASKRDGPTSRRRRRSILTLLVPCNDYDSISCVCSYLEEEVVIRIIL